MKRVQGPAGVSWGLVIVVHSNDSNSQLSHSTYYVLGPDVRALTCVSNFSFHYGCVRVLLSPPFYRRAEAQGSEGTHLRPHGW